MRDECSWAGPANRIRACVMSQPGQAELQFGRFAAIPYNHRPLEMLHEASFADIHLGNRITEERPPAIALEEFTELGEYLALPARTYSAGMLTRLGFAIATAIDPEILVLDEGLGAGDARFADKAKQRVDALIERTSILILASHSDALIQAMCNRAILMHSGRLEMDGKVDDVLAEYRKMAHRSQ